MTVKAVIVPDIIRHRRLAGAYQHDRFRKRVLIACPCGCGEITEIDARKWITTGVDKLPSCNSEVSILWYDAGVERVHWAGRLNRGEFEGELLIDYAPREASDEN